MLYFVGLVLLGGINDGLVNSYFSVLFILVFPSSVPYLLCFSLSFFIPLLLRYFVFFGTFDFPSSFFFIFFYFGCVCSFEFVILSPSPPPFLILFLDSSQHRFIPTGPQIPRFVNILPFSTPLLPCPSLGTFQEAAQTRLDPSPPTPNQRRGWDVEGGKEVGNGKKNQSPP